MRKLMKWTFFGMVVLSCAANLSIAEETVIAEKSAIGVDLTADFMSKYIWRGQNLNDDFVFQPSVAVTFDNFTASIWGNQDLTGYHNHVDATGNSGESGEFTELDYSLDYTNKVPGFEKLNYSVGVIYYDFPNTVLKDTTEIYWGLSYDCFLKPSVTLYHDIDEAKGTYASFGISHSIEKIFAIGETPVGMELGASLGYGSSAYNKYYWGGLDQAKVNDLTMSASFPIALGSWTVSPSINYVTLLNSDIRRQDTYRSESDYFFTGISIGKSF